MGFELGKGREKLGTEPIGKKERARLQRERDWKAKLEALPDLSEVEAILGYKFKNLGLLEEAFTHVSCPDTCISYEQLEYFGDSVLNGLITREQMFRYPDESPDMLTRLRSVNVDTEKLGRVAIKLRLHRYLRHNMPILESQIQEFSKEILEYPLHSFGLVDPPKVLADIVESTIGAVYKDSGTCMVTVWKVFKELLEPIIVPETLKNHPKTQLLDECQKRGLHVFLEDLWEKQRKFEVFVDGKFVGSGSYGPKKEIAENRAAKVALENLTKQWFE